MVDVSYYTNRITSQHASQPKFTSTVTALVQPFVDQQSFLQNDMINAFDIDQAVGPQLDILGQWIGRDRSVTIPIAGAYFSWDTPAMGWDQANWRGPFDSSNGIVSLDDDTYRNLLRAKIILNHGDGTTATAAAAIQKLFVDFPNTVVSIKDNLDMSITVSISGVVPPAVYLTLLDNGELVVTPTGVSATFTVTSVNTVALFGWDTENATIQGWDQGAWAGSLGLGPGQVVGLAKVSVTSTSVTYSWLTPTIGTGPFTFQMQWRVTGSGQNFQLFGQPLNVTQGTITGLPPNTSVDVEVYAVNSTGPGLPSAPLTLSTLAGLPPQVTNLKSQTITQTSIALTWDSLGTGYSYSVSSRPSGSGNYTVLGTTSSTTYSAGNLQSASLYDFTVSAINALGTGPASVPLTVGTQGAVPGSISNLNATALDANDVSLSWMPPTTGATGVNLTYTVLQAVNVNPVTYQAVTGLTFTNNSDGSVSTIVSNLAGSTSLLFQVYASNPSGNGPTSSPVGIITPAAAPAEVSDLSLASDTSSSVTLTWSAVPGAALYQTQYMLDGDSTWINGPAVTGTTATISLPVVTGTTQTQQTAPTIPTPTPRPSGTRPWAYSPGTKYSFHNTPIGSGAVYSLASDADTISARNGYCYINQPDNYGSPCWRSFSTNDHQGHFQLFEDVWDEEGNNYNGQTINLHIPTGATSAGPQPMYTDQATTLIDTNSFPGLYFFGGPLDITNFSADQTFTIAEQGTAYQNTNFFRENVTLDVYAEQQEQPHPIYNQAAGLLTQYDVDPTMGGQLIPGTSLVRINHVLRYSADPADLKANGTGQGGETMNPSAWPLNYEDWQDPSAAQGSLNNSILYRGNLLYGSHLCIPTSTQMPSNLGAPGQQIWDCLVNYGASIHDGGAGGIHYFADQDVCNYQGGAWYNQAINDLQVIKTNVTILRNQHQRGQNFIDYPVQGPGTRLVAGPGHSQLLPGFPVPSEANSFVTSASTSPIVDTMGCLWSINSNAQVVYQPNGKAATVDTGTSNVQYLAMCQGYLAHMNTQGLWYTKSNYTLANWDGGTTTSPIPSNILNPTPPPPPTAPTGGLTWLFRVYPVSS